MTGHRQPTASVLPGPRRKTSRGFTLVELVIALFVGTVLTAMAVPLWTQAQAIMRLNSMVSAMSSAISQTRYRSIMTSQPYTLVINSPGDTYLVTNLTTGTADPTIPLTPHAVAINGGGSASYTFVFCPNGTVWSAVGTTANCPGTGVPPALSAAYENRQINLNVSSVGNVTTTNVK